MWSLTVELGRVRRDGDQGLEGSGPRSTEQMYGEVFGAVSQIPGLQRLPPPRPAAADARAVRRGARAPERRCRRSSCWRSVGAVVAAGWQSGKFLYVDTDLKIDLPEARVVIDRERVADLGLDLAGVGRSWARCSAART